MPSTPSMASPAGIAQANRAFFDDQAAKYESKHEKSLSQLTDAIRARLAFIGADWVDEDGEKDGKQVRLLDYACGTGMISRALAPYTTQCVGIDISAEMVRQYNTRAGNQALSQQEMYAYVGDLGAEEDGEAGPLSSPDFFNFQVAAVGGALHHIRDPDLVARRLVDRLQPGGVLVVWDFLPHDVDGHVASHTVIHHGFSEHRIREIFENAGAGANYAIDILGDGIVSGHGDSTKRCVFLARGEKSR